MLEELKNKKILIVVESPSKSKHIQEIVKAAGYNNMKVIASAGHIMTLKDGGKCYNSGIDPDNDFSLNLAIAEDKKDIVKKIKDLASTSDYVYLMSDGDREGEVIAWSLIHFLKIPAKKYKRVITHEITPKAVLSAIENPIELDKNLIDAGLARLTLDKLVGYSLSPIAKTYLGARSVGRCQSAGLKLIADRENEIINFKPEKYFDLYLNFKKDDNEFKAKYIGTKNNIIEHINTQAEAEDVIKKCNKDYVISSVIKKERGESPKPPFCTSTFQQEVASKIGLSIKDAMSIVQKLYESGKVTYIRTDDTTMSPEFIEVLKEYVNTIYGPDIFVNPRIGKKQENAQEGHECLRVTDPALTPEKLIALGTNDLQAKVYRLIWQRTIASVMPNAKISETSYIIENNDQLFSMVSNELMDSGYRKIYNYKDDDCQEEIALKTTFNKGELLANCKLNLQAKETKPKPRYTEASLDKELEKMDIGRPSTFSTIISTVLSESRGYCELKQREIYPTEKGMQLSSYLDRAFPGIINLNYTAEMEKSLDKISQGTLTKLQFLTEFYNNLTEAISKNIEKTPQEKETVKCPLCGKTMVIRRNRYGKLFYGCSDYPNCKGITNIK